MARARIYITGIVQGVGFRPFVYREAVARGLAGWVLNASDGVHVEAVGARATVEKFARALSANAPAAARVDAVQVSWLDEKNGDGAADNAAAGRAGAGAPRFEIRTSNADTARTTLVSPDIATCPDCVRELFDPADRRYHYPFINCTNCGPRFTIIRDLPYDRPATSMAPFPLCPSCAAEYADPLDRRFHAQPDACFACGPHLTWRERADAAGKADGKATPAVGTTREESDAVIARCAALIAQGGIVAVKGLGGFHLACNAGDDTAVRELRRRKRRSNKPLAVMVRTLRDAEALCRVSPAERELLSGSVRPIVLLRRRATDCGARTSPTPPAASGATHAAGAPVLLAPAVTFDLPEVGVMLPYTPLQHLLMAACAETGVRALVMTSGNLSEEPIETDDDLAWKRLVASGIADALLGNDRAILSRYDDSVVRVGADGAPLPVRRARGYAPPPLPLPTAANPTRIPALLCCGAEQKATFAYTRENGDGAAACFLSQHIGDIENAETMDAWHEARTRFSQLFDLAADALVCDAHPRYLASQWARAEAARRGIPLVEVQHHHAHLAAVLAEAACDGHACADARVIGVAFDGTGAGATYCADRDPLRDGSASARPANAALLGAGTLEPDGTIWGGEVLIASLTGFERAAHLRPWRLPGGAASVRDARRNAYALLSDYGLLDEPAAQGFAAELGDEVRSVTHAMLKRSLNSPVTTSMGRLFDAAAALLGICGQATYEGEPAIELEAAAWRAVGENSAGRALEAAAATVFVGDEIAALTGENHGTSERAGASCDASEQCGIGVRDAANDQHGAGDRCSVDDRCGAGERSIAGERQAADNESISDGRRNASDRCVAGGQHATAPRVLTPRVLDPAPVLLALLEAQERGMDAGLLALAFHEAVAQATCRVAVRLGAQTGLETVALSGGVFMNRLLLERVRQLLRAAGLAVLVPSTVPVNDGCIAYGQAAIARARLAAGLA